MSAFANGSADDLELVWQETNAAVTAEAPRATRVRSFFIGLLDVQSCWNRRSGDIRPWSHQSSSVVQRQTSAHLCDGLRIARRAVIRRDGQLRLRTGKMGTPIRNHTVAAIGRVAAATVPLRWCETARRRRLESDRSLAQTHCSAKAYRCCPECA